MNESAHVSIRCARRRRRNKGSQSSRQSLLHSATPTFLSPRLQKGASEHHFKVFDQSFLTPSSNRPRHFHKHSTCPGKRVDHVSRHHGNWATSNGLLFQCKWSMSGSCSVCLLAGRRSGVYGCRRSTHRSSAQAQASVTRRTDYDLVGALDCWRHSPMEGWLESILAARCDIRHSL